MSLDDASIFRNIVDLGITFLDDDGRVKINGDLFREVLSAEVSAMDAQGGLGGKVPAISGS